MMTKRPILVGSLLPLFLCSMVACAGDPAKQADSAHDAELKSERKQINAAEAQRDNTDAVATGGGNAPATKNNASANATMADAKMMEARDVARAKSTERLEKLDAKTSELKQLVDKAGGKAPTAARDSLKTVETQRGLVTSALDQFPKVSNDDFKQAKTSLDTQLDILEGLVKKATTEVGKIKK
jgi:hypothetical protein